MQTPSASPLEFLMLLLGWIQYIAKGIYKQGCWHKRQLFSAQSATEPAPLVLDSTVIIENAETESFLPLTLAWKGAAVIWKYFYNNLCYLPPNFASFITASNLSFSLMISFELFEGHIANLGLRNHIRLFECRTPNYPKLSGHHS